MTPDLKTSPPPATLFSEDAEAIAKYLDESAKNGRDSGKNKSTQIRRFYDELVGWQERIGTDEAAYAQGRNLVTREFVQWLRDCIKQIDGPRTLNHFRLHFEAMIGFLKAIRG